jgi:hypothetical protein
MWRALALLVGVSSLECMKYKCYSGTDPVASDTCGWLDSSDSRLLELKVCSDKTNVYCDIPTTASTTNTTCTSYPTPTRKQANPGDLCNIDAECVGASYCSNKVCTGYPLGAYCTAHNQCDAGLFCDVTGKCQAQKYAGDDCTSDEECRNSLGCDKAMNESTGVCVGYYSLDKGSRVKQCILDVVEYKNNLCVTGVCEPDKPGMIGPGICTQNYLSSINGRTIGIECNSDKDCVGYGAEDSSKTKQGKCSCGMNPYAKKYCELWSGDSPAAELLSTMKRHIIADYTFFCHTESRWDEACFTRTLTSGSVVSLIGNKMLVENFPRTYQAESCVTDIYMRKYSLLNSNLYTCSSYNCDSTLGSTCIDYDAKDNEFRVKSCGTKQMTSSECDYTMSLRDEWVDVQCNNTLPVILSYPGEPCKLDSECTSNKCVKNVCIGLQAGEECNIINPYECDVGLFCQENIDENICQPLQTDGQGCTHDFECENSLGCYWDSHTATGVCRQYFTVADNDPVPCPLTGEQPLCLSAWCSQVDHDLGICIDAPKSIKTLPFACDTDSQCTGKNSLGTQNYSRCRCSYSFNHESYCDLFPGDDIGIRHFKTLQGYVQSGALNKCQTGRRFAPQCLDLAAASSISNGNYNATVVLHMNYGAFGLYQNNSECVKEVFTREYWSHYQAPDDDDDDDDWAWALTLSVGVLAVLI